MITGEVWFNKHCPSLFPFHAIIKILIVLIIQVLTYFFKLFWPMVGVVWIKSVSSAKIVNKLEKTNTVIFSNDPEFWNLKKSLPPKILIRNNSFGDQIKDNLNLYKKKHIDSRLAASTIFIYYFIAKTPYISRVTFRFSERILTHHPNATATERCQHGSKTRTWLRLLDKSPFS